MSQSRPFGDIAPYRNRTNPFGSYRSHSIDRVNGGGASVAHSNPYLSKAPFLPKPVFTMRYHAHPVDKGSFIAGGALLVSPTDGFSGLGYIYGLMSLCIDPDSITYTLQNTTDHSVDWTAVLSSGMDSYFTLSQASGTLAAGDSTTVVVTVSLGFPSPMDVSGTITFTNTTDGIEAGVRNLDLEIGDQPMLDTMSFVSTATYATLIGWSEFTDASVPPKKYLTKVCSGQVVASYYTPTDCSGSATGWTGQKYSGQTTYDTGTGLPVDGVNEYAPAGGAGSQPFPVAWGSPSVTLDMNFPAKESTTCLDCTTTRINRYALGNGTCGTCYSSPAPQSVSALDCNLEENLTNEDTEAAAWARAVPSIGTSQTASKHMVRGAGEFDFGETTVEYTFSCSQLIVGLTYTLRLSYYVTPVGGGSSVEETEDVEFTASATSQDVVGTFTADEGYDKELFSAEFICASDPDGGGGGPPPPGP